MTQPKITQKDIYLSYNNAQLDFTLKLALSLLNYQASLWFDRIEVDFNESWGQNIVFARENTSYALVVLSNEYLHSSYCQEELQTLQTQETKLIGIVTEDIVLASVAEQLAIDDWIDFRDWHDEAAYKTSCNILSSKLEALIPKTVPPERFAYIIAMITAMEANLFHTITGHVSARSDIAKSYENHNIRPRGYIENVLTEGIYLLQEQTENLQIEDFKSLFKLRSKVLLKGDVGSGKSVIGYLLTLMAAHEYLNDFYAPLPIWIDLLQWNQNQTFDSFMDDNWSLAHERTNWMANNPVLFVFDNVDEALHYHADLLDELSPYCSQDSKHEVLLISREQIISNVDITTVSIESMQKYQLNQLSRELLPTVRHDVFNQIYLQQSKNTYMQRVDYAAIGLDLLASETEIDTANWHKNLIIRFITIRWHQAINEQNVYLSLDEFIDRLKYLAWQMMLNQRTTYLHFAEVADLLGDEGIIELGLYLKILSHHQDFIRFEAQVIQHHLAAYHLLLDGIYKYLQKPQFGTNGARLPNKWDSVVLALYAIAEDEQQAEIIEQVAAIDPFLAHSYLQQDSTLLRQNLDVLIASLVDIRRKDVEAHYALLSTLGSINFVEDAALSLVKLLQDADWSLQYTIYELILRLSLVIPESVVVLVRKLDRQRDDVEALLSRYTLPRWIVYLSHLSHHPDQQIQLNAIHLMRALDDPLILCGLFALINSKSDSVRELALAAIADMNDDFALSELLLWLPQNYAYFADVADVFRQSNRPMTAYIVQEIAEQDNDLIHEICTALANTSEEQLAKMMIKLLGLHHNIPTELEAYRWEGQDKMNLHDLLKRGINTLKDRETFNQLVEDASRVFNIVSPINDTKVSSANLQKRTQAALDANPKQENSAPNRPSLPSKLKKALSHKSWEIRVKAVQRLSDYRPEQILPYLLKTAKDDETQVRLASLDLLSKLMIHLRAQQAVMAALSDEDYLVIDTVADYLKSSSMLDSNLLFPLLQHENLQTVAATIDILGTTKDATAVPMLIDFLDDERIPWLGEKTIGQCAAQALLSIGTPKAIQAIDGYGYVAEPELSHVILPDDTEQVQQKRNYKTAEKVQLSLKALRSDDWSLSQKAARYLRELAQKLEGETDKAIILPLEEALSDEVWTVRWAAVESLAWIKNSETMPTIATLLLDEHWIVQVAAIRALVELNASDYAVQIARLLNDSVKAVVEAAVEALGMLENDAVLPHLEQKLNSKDEFIRLAVLKAIHNILQAQSVPYLTNALDDSYDHIRWFAIKHLCLYTDTSYTDFLNDLLDDGFSPAWEKHTIGDYAAQALASINVQRD